MDGGSVWFFFFSSRRRHTRLVSDWSSDVCSSDLEMIGLLVAVERYVNEDWQDRARRYERTVERWIEHFDGVPGLVASRVFPNEAGQPTPRCRVAFASETGLSGAEAARMLWEGDPRIAVAVDGPDAISMTPELLEEDDEAILFDRIAALTLQPAAPAAS